MYYVEKGFGPGSFTAQREQLLDNVLNAKRLGILLFAGIIVHQICYISHFLKGANSDLGIAISESLSHASIILATMLPPAIQRNHISSIASRELKHKEL